MSRVLVFAAHPDDEVLGMGGTIAVHAERGDEVRIVVVTDGSSTQYPGDADTRARKDGEAVSAAAELGVTDYVHLDLPDMRLEFGDPGGRTRLPLGRPQTRILTDLRISFPIIAANR